MTTVEHLHEQGVLSALDVHLARTLSRLGQESREQVILAVGLLSRHVAAGNVCIDLDDPRSVDGAGTPIDPEWPALLASSPLVDDGHGEAPTPLVLNGSRLYLRRHWEDECALAADLRTRAGAPVPLDTARFRTTLDQLLASAASDDAAGDAAGDATDWQRVAAFLALRRRLCIITGGPGTGKTTTVVTIAALAIDQAQAQQARPPRIALCAPTGKAAGRLTEAVRAATQRLTCAAHIREALPEEALTIHRLLGASSTRPGRFRYDARTPLTTDLLIVDEASMVDLALMTRLVAALPPTAGLILLGDRHQLASVESGAVLGDLCPSDQRATYSHACAADVHAATGIDIPQEPTLTSPAIRDCVVTLTRSHRFDTRSDIGLLASAIRDGDADAVVAILEASTHPSVTWIEPPAGARAPAPAAALRETLVAGFSPYVRAATPMARLAALADFRILCAHQHGPDGVVTMNQAAEHALVDANLLRADSTFYDARPLLVTRNDYRLALFNGDIGTIVHGDDDNPERRALFLSPDGTERWLSPGRLPPCDTAFAVSIHKSQGSELDQVLIMLPTRTSPVLSRELLYTAVSRARQRVTICATLEIIREAVDTPVRRASGLADRMQEN